MSTEDGGVITGSGLVKRLDQAFYSQIDRAEDDASEHCELAMTQNAPAHDAQEGMTAFLEKRTPVRRGE
ncbi:MAG: hypothetical protein ACXVVQ_10645 [Solirubrobacteraceae bacterium]